MRDTPEERAQVQALADELGVDLDHWPTIPPPESGRRAEDHQPKRGQWLVTGRRAS